MIKILILINLVLGLAVGCSEQEQQEGGASPDATVAGEGEADPLKQLQDEGRLPPSVEGTRTPVLSDPSVLSGSGPEVVSLFPPTVDPDQDNVPNSPIAGHPEIRTDNCPAVFNPTQEDSDSDGIGNACD